MQSLIQGLELFGWLVLALIVVMLYVGIFVRPPGQLKVGDAKPSRSAQPANRDDVK